MTFVWILLALVLGGMAYIRLAPHDVSRWHRAAPDDLGDAMGETRLAGGHILRQPVGGDATARMAELDAAVRATPRTEVLSGSLTDGQITYVTRSKLMGFPDYTTLTLLEGTPPVLEIYSRLRFGKSDTGVNRRRIAGWLGKG